MPPLLGLSHPPPHIFKYCQLLDFSDRYESISMTFSEIILLAWRRKICEENTKICHPLRGLPRAAQPPIIKHALSRPIMNRFLLNFQKLVSQQVGKEWMKNMLKNATPSSGCPTPIFSNTVNYLISLTIMNEYR